MKRFTLAAIVFVVVLSVWAVKNFGKNTILVQYELELAEFTEYIARFSKSYKDESELNKKFLVYRQNLAYILISNQIQGSYTLAPNEFADLTFEEFSAFYLSDIPLTNSENLKAKKEQPLTLPNAVDWRAKGAVTPVKNQGSSCTAGWAFATTGSIEGAWKLSNHPLIILSEQQLLDCSSTQGNKGCSGGTFINGFKYVQANGLTNETNYPYQGSTGHCNKSATAKILAKISNYTSVTPQNSLMLKTAISVQPVAVNVDANPSIWQFYSQGTVNGTACGTTLNHSVLVVGYSLAADIPYYIIKNSWGVTWGLDGYMQIAIEEGAGVCGIQMSPAYPLV